MDLDFYGPSHASFAFHPCRLCRRRSFGGCDNLTKREIGTGVGAVAGVVVGSMFGSGSGRAVAMAIGGAAGGLAGAAIGAELDKQDKLKAYRAAMARPTRIPPNRSTGSAIRIAMSAATPNPPDRPPWTTMGGCAATCAASMSSKARKRPRPTGSVSRTANGSPGRDRTPSSRSVGSRRARRGVADA